MSNNINHLLRSWNTCRFEIGIVEEWTLEEVLTECCSVLINLRFTYFDLRESFDDNFLVFVHHIIADCRIKAIRSFAWAIFQVRIAWTLFNEWVAWAVVTLTRAVVALTRAVVALTRTIFQDRIAWTLFKERVAWTNFSFWVTWTHFKQWIAWTLFEKWVAGAFFNTWVAYTILGERVTWAVF